MLATPLLLLLVAACAQTDAGGSSPEVPPDPVQAAFEERAAQVADAWAEDGAAGAAALGDFFPPADLADSDTGLRGADAVLESDGTTLTVRLGIGACDEDPQPLAYETAVAIVVAGRVTPPAPDVACTMQLVHHPVTATLNEPVRERPILDLFTGQELVTES